MTISSSDNRWSYAGDGSTTAFPIAGKFFAASDIKVYLDGALQSSGYTITGAGGSGGTCTFVTAPANGVIVLLVRDVPFDQQAALLDDGPFPAGTVERGLDKATVLAQQNKSGLARALRLADSDPAMSAPTLPPVADRADKYLKFDAVGNAVAVALLDAGVLEVTAFIESLLDDADLAAARATLQMGSVSAQTGDFTAGTTHEVLYVVTPSGATATCTLPQASAVPSGFAVRVKNATDGKGVLVNRAGSDTIDGETSLRVPGRGVVELVRSGAGEWTLTRQPAHMVGELVEWASDTLPAGGWLWPDGAAVSRSTYRGLFDMWGTVHGAGDGSTTFNVIDKRGRVPAGRDNMGGNAANRLNVALTGNTTNSSPTVTALSATDDLCAGMRVIGAGIPANTTILSIDSGSQITLSQNATASASGVSLRFGMVDGATLGAAGGKMTHKNTVAETAAHTHQSFTSSVQAQPGSGTTTIVTGATGSTGGDRPHNNTQPTIVVNYIVKT